MYRLYRALTNIVLAFTVAASALAAQISDELISQKDFFKTATAADVKELLQGISLEGVSVAEENYTSLTPLMRAARDTPYPEVIDLLVQAGCDVNAYSQPPQIPGQEDYRAWQNERTALHFAVKNPNPEVLRALLSYKPDLEARYVPHFTGTALYMASESSLTFSHFMQLLEAGADATQDYPASDKSYRYKSSPLWRNFIGRRGGALDKPLRELREPAEAVVMAKALLKAGCEPDTHILGLALYGGQNEVARLLLDAGANPKDDNLLFQALTRPSAHEESSIPYTDTDLVEVLIKHNDVNFIPKYEAAPLLLACQSGADAAVVRMLLEAGAKLHGNKKKSEYEPLNAMLIEVMKGSRDNPELVKYLLSIGISPVGGREEPLRLAFKGPLPKPLSAIELVKAGADPNIFARELFHVRHYLLQAGIVDRNGNVLLQMNPSPAMALQQKAEHAAILALAKKHKRTALHNRGIYKYLTPDEIRELVGWRSLSRSHTFTTKQRPASYGGILEFFDWLRPDEIVRHETTAMIEAAGYTPYPEVIDILAEADCSARALDSKVVHFAIDNSNPKVLAAVLRHGADVHRLSASSVGKDGVPGHIPVLVSAGWDIKKHGGKALLAAARMEKIAMARALMGAEVDLNESDSDGERALNYLIHNNDYELALELIEAGAEYSYQDKYGRSLLQEAEKYRPKMTQDEKAYNKLMKQLQK